MPDPDMQVRTVVVGTGRDAPRRLRPTGRAAKATRRGSGPTRWRPGSIDGLRIPERCPFGWVTGRDWCFWDGGKLYILDRASEAPRELLSLEPGQVGDFFHISRDDRWIFIAREDEESNLWLMTLD